MTATTSPPSLDTPVRPRHASIGGNALRASVLGSMAMGEWISVQSSRELFQRELAVERAEIAAFPAEQHRELVFVAGAAIPSLAAAAVTYGTGVLLGVSVGT